MKKITLYFVAALMLLPLFPGQVNASATPTPTTTSAPAPTDALKAEVLLARLDEIKSMDMKSLASADKKQLRKEVRAIKSDLKALSGGVYLSAAAIVVIILLVVLLL